MISPCPHCQTRTHDYDIVHYPDPEQERTFSPLDDADEAATPEPIRWNEQEAVILLPCEHVFTRESLDEVLSALREHRELRIELKTTEDPDRVRALKEWELPAAKNAVENAKRDVERLKELEDAINHVDRLTEDDNE